MQVPTSVRLSSLGHRLHVGGDGSVVARGRLPHSPRLRHPVRRHRRAGPRPVQPALREVRVGVFVVKLELEKVVLAEDSYEAEQAMLGLLYYDRRTEAYVEVCEVEGPDDLREDLLYDYPIGGDLTVLDHLEQLGLAPVEDAGQ